MMQEVKWVKLVLASDVVSQVIFQEIVLRAEFLVPLAKATEPVFASAVVRLAMYQKIAFQTGLLMH